MINPKEINHEWLEKFYSPTNIITSDDEWKRFRYLWGKFHFKVGHPICFIYSNEEEKINFYFGSQTIKGANSLRQELMSFVGNYPPFFSGLPYNLDLTIGHENLLSDIFVQPCFKISVTKKDNIEKIKEKLFTYGQLIDRKPELTKKIKLPFGQIRDLFDKAIISGDHLSAYRYKNDLISTGRLTPPHELFLEIRLIAGLGFWDRLNNNDLRKLIDFRNILPVTIIRDIADYFYSVAVTQFENSVDIDGCLKQLSHYKFEEFTGFFAKKKLIKNKKSLTVFLLAELVQENIDINYSISIYNEIDKIEKSSLVEKIKQKYLDLSKNIIVDSLKDGDQYFLDEEYDKAVNSYFKVIPSSKILEKITRCLYSKFQMTPLQEWKNEEGYDEKEINNVLGYYEDLPNEEQNKFNISKRNKDFIDILRSTDQVSDILETQNEWVKWISKLKQNKNIKESVEFLKNYISDWSINDFEEDPDKLEIYFQQLLLFDEELFNLTYLKLYEKFFIDNELNNKDYSNFIIEFFERLVQLDNFNINDLQICFSLQEKILELGLSPIQYRKLIDALRVVITPEKIGLNNFDLMLDISEAFSYFPKTDESASTEFHASILEIGQKYSQRIDQNQKLCLRKLSNDLGGVPNWLELTTEEKDAEVEFFETSYSHLNNKKVGIYTLNENAGKRIREIITSKVPSCNINLNSDKECTQRLKALASNSDIFVFSWKCSKHQAFYCIQNNRSKELPFLQPLGKGSASILRELVKIS